MTPPLRRAGRKKRALIVNCYVDETRRRVARAHKVPQTLGPVFLAGALDPESWDIRLYNEISHGSLEDERVLAWPDLVVLTGLVTSLDRMRQVTAYARTLNPKVVVVGGGHVVRAFPSYCGTFLDYACQGDIEELRDVVREAFGAGYASDAWSWRYDLCDWIGRIGYAESSRYCNFACSFCTMTAEGRAYSTYSADSIRAQVRAGGRRRYVVFLDNNFYGSDRRSFRERVATAGALRREGWYRGWSALVTSDFFLDSANVRLARDSGCAALFSGVESFDTEWAIRHNKRHNAVRSQVQAIEECLEAGVVFLYGLILDLTTRSVADVRRELDAIMDCPDITLPAYVCLPIPLPGTPHFHDSLRDGLILPETSVRDLDGTTVSLQPRDGVDEAARFIRDLQSMAGYRTKIARHSLGFWHRHRRRLTGDQMLMALGNGAVLAAPLLATGPRRMRRRGARRTHVSTTEPRDAFYRPAFRVESRFEDCFEPAMLTDSDGAPAAPLAEDLLRSRPAMVSITSRRLAPPASARQAT